jgi:nucleosome binding factor SPN SPT16 subunit
MKDGVSARDVYLHAVSYIKDKKPELERHFVKNVGFGVCHKRVFCNLF